MEAQGEANVVARNALLSVQSWRWAVTATATTVTLNAKLGLYERSGQWIEALELWNTLATEAGGPL